MESSKLRYCPHCTGRLEWQLLPEQVSRHPVCTKCGFVLWQNPKPCVDALILSADDRKILLGCRSNNPSAGLWDIPGGFLNVGDSPEEAVRRECLREYGVEVKVVQLLGAFDGEFLESALITLVYICHLIDGEPQARDIVDEVEWFPVSQPPQLAFPEVEQALHALHRYLEIKR